LYGPSSRLTEFFTDDHGALPPTGLFEPAAINDNGSAIGTVWSGGPAASWTSVPGANDTGVPAVWTGAGDPTQLDPSVTLYSINNIGLVFGVEDGGAGFIWNKGAYCWLANLIPTAYQAEVDPSGDTLNPRLLSNDVNGIIQILFDAAYVDPVSGSVSTQTFVLTGPSGNLTNSTGWTLALVQLPNGESPGDIQCINANGALATVSSGVGPAVGLLLPVALKNVTFGGSSNIPLATDNNVAYTTPQWTVTGTNYPVAYQCDTYPSIGATLKLPPGFSYQVLYGDEDISIPATALTPGATAGEYILPSTPSTEAFDEKVAFYDNNNDYGFELDWEISADGGKTWTQFATTTHTMYETLGKPTTGYRMESLFYIGCQNAAGVDKTDKDEVSDSIWQAFTGLYLTNVTGTPLTYYANWAVSSSTTPGFLANHDGQCGDWAKFLIDVRRAQGFTDINNCVQFAPPGGNTYAYMFVDPTSWAFPKAGKSPVSGFPYLNTWKNSYINGNSYKWIYADLTSKGSPGQGNKFAKSLFPNHFVVPNPKGGYFDPSYGHEYSDTTDFQTNYLAALGEDCVWGATGIASVQSNLVPNQIITQTMPYPSN
jgi:hypothetical protein